MKRKNWFWNIVIVLTFVGCILAFVLHYKNWSKFEEGSFQIASGIYKQRIPVEEIDEVLMVQKLPKMQRKNGFSWLAKEKGVFIDSLTQRKTYVFVDDLWQQKLQLKHHDSLVLYLNFTDSLKTQEVFDKLSLAIK
ncbi:PH domain-containing protein [Croceitalea rosinachiae]|uniref:PH domain-containing protein n=1 Tax=Croceitalea rosinachiae TaxID=3075596 RepID=A0ABU3A7Y2_9FLAO|nr:PH domain-containing protein [Croceitalea sp. F388]MDT0605985.1 PH domain-containing protein [Croceitalea sp. F388]